MQPEFPSGNVTLLFTDVEGSTKLLHELGVEAYTEALAEHRRLIREACTAHDGVEVDTQGDAFFVVFPTAPGALTAAGEMTEALATGPIQVRIGLHTGTAHLTSEGYVGNDVHLAARVAASGHGGQILVSAATAALIEPSGSEPQALSLVDLGEHRLKDIEEAVAIFQLGHGSFPPLKTISNTNLPRPASSFVGRRRELDEVLARVHGGARLVTLSGPGGSGKTRLAIEAAASLVPEYRAGVFWVALASLRDPVLVSETISQTLGARDGLAEHIGERELLLLLDNLEQVIEAAPELVRLLSSCPNLTLLVTSRELLRVQGEVEYPVPPLAEPEAVSLFCERAQTEPNQDIRELCGRLDNLPLAVELAAARTKALSPARILERLSQRLDLLQGGRDADPRQQTLRTTIAWSHDLLSEDEQGLFRRLSVVAGGCTLEAAEEVADADLDTLQSLVEKSLLRYTNERYWMLETIREYALERLEESGDAAKWRSRHGQHYFELVEAGRERLTQVQHLGLFDAELENLRTALAWALGADGPAAQAALGLRLAGAMGRFWYLRAHLLEGSAWLERALSADPGERVEDRATALRWLGVLADERGDLSVARAALEESTALSRAGGDRAQLARSLLSLGIVARNEADGARARELMMESLEIRRELGDRADLSAPLSNLGLMAVDEGDLERASALLEESLAVDREFHDIEGIAINLVNLATIAIMRNEPERARGLLAEALRAFTDVGDPDGVASCLETIAVLGASQGRAAHAARLAGAAAALREQHSTPLAATDQAGFDRDLTPAREALGERAFAEAFAAGQDLTREEAVAEARIEVDAAAPTSAPL